MKNLFGGIVKNWMLIAGVIAFIVFYSLFLVPGILEEYTSLDHVVAKTKNKDGSIAKGYVGKTVVFDQETQGLTNPEESYTSSILKKIEALGFPLELHIGRCDTIRRDSMLYWLVSVKSNIVGKRGYLRIYRTDGQEPGRYGEFLDVYWNKDLEKWVPAGNDQYAKPYIVAMEEYGNRRI